MSGDVMAALSAELLKVRRSVVPWVTLIAFTLAGAVGALFMFVLQDPDRARALGLLGAKAQLAGTGSADWAAHLGFTAQVVSVGGLLLFGMVTTWLFGREFADGTAKDLMAMPTSRSAVVVAKLVVATAWSLLLAAYVLALSLASGWLLGLPGWSVGIVARGAAVVMAVAMLTALLAAGYGLVASVGRGYLAAVGAVFATLVAAQVVAALGYGAWFPWAVPSLVSGAAGPGQAVGPAGVLSVVVVGAAAWVGTARWWEHADHAR